MTSKSCSDFIKLLNWSKQFSDLPWRQSRSLYRTLVSEIMLQQTTVPTVLNKFENFIAQYPSINDLANTTEDDILIAWKGLGYYRRAKNLLNAAKVIAHEYNGVIPSDYHKLITIPGIGDYTASALLAIGLDQKRLAIDTNLERVITRYYGLDIAKGPKLKQKILELFENKKIFNCNLSFRALNEALMDLGREYCGSSKTLCDSCPLQSSCKTRDNPLSRPIQKAKTKISHQLLLLRVLIIEDNTLLVYKKSTKEWLSGQWECPTFIIKCDDPTLSQYPYASYENYQDLSSVKTTITKYSITNYIVRLTLQEFQQRFQSCIELTKVRLSTDSNLSTATQKALLNSKIVIE